MSGKYLMNHTTRETVERYSSRVISRRFVVLSPETFSEARCEASIYNCGTVN